MSNKPPNQQKLYDALEELLKLPENKECADCGTKAPRWASINFGIFVCIRCSGIHRSMGTHISKVRSVSLDKWTPEQVEFMGTMGNAKAKAIYEADVSGHSKGDIRTDNIALEQWIRDKYERKRFMRRDYEPRAPSHEPPTRSRSGSDSRPVHHSNPYPPPASSIPVNAAPVSKPAPKPAPPKPAPVVAAPAKQPEKDLLNWDEPTKSPAANNSGDIFGDFVGSGAGAGAGGADFGLNGGPAHPTVDKNSILQLYKTPLTPAAGGFHPPHLGGPPHIGGYPPYGVPPTPYGVPPPGYGVPPAGYPPGAYGVAPPGAYGALPGGYGPVPGGYGGVPGGYGGGYGAPPPTGSYGAPGFGGAPVAPGFGGAAPPQGGPNYNLGAGLGVPGAAGGGFPPGYFNQGAPGIRPTPARG